MAPIWPTGFTLAGQSINLTGKITGVILLGDSFGGMVLPTLVGKVIVGSGPRVMVYLVFGSLVLNLLAFAGMLYLRPTKKPSITFIRNLPRRSMPDWLEKAVFYEIYPQSFFDSNGDGIGDLPGILQKLEYLQYLGINAVWLNPCFASPFQDAGYDISDFYQVAPRYGTNEDLRTLFEEAGRLGIRILLDLVPGHTSIEHPWFQASARHKHNEFSDWYIWTDSGWTWEVPGVRLVNGYGERDATFITNFFYCQPALNYGFANPDPNYPWQQPVDAPGPQQVRKELRNIMKFWLDLGASGFRVDMAASLIKNDPGWRETIKLWQEIRVWLTANTLTRPSFPNGAALRPRLAPVFTWTSCCILVQRPIRPCFANLIRAEPVPTNMVLVSLTDLAMVTSWNSWMATCRNIKKPKAKA